MIKSTNSSHDMIIILVMADVSVLWVEQHTRSIFLTSAFATKIISHNVSVIEIRRFFAGMTRIGDSRAAYPFTMSNFVTGYLLLNACTLKFSKAESQLKLPMTP